MDVVAIKKVFIENEVDLTKDDIWAVQKAWVIKHSALERLAAKLGISFEEPVMLQGPHQSNWDGSSYAMLVRGSRKIKTDAFWEWSVGEVNASNYRTSGKQPAYQWAMVEKRAKDRVIIKLSGLHGAYSEDEADDFSDKDKKTFPKHEEVAGGDTPSPPGKEGGRAKAQAIVKEAAKSAAPETKVQASDDQFSGLSEEQREIIDAVAELGEIVQVSEYMMSPEVQDVLKASKPDDRNMIRAYAHERVKALGWLAPKDQKKDEE